MGRTKVFLKDAQDLFLEQERDRVLTRKILVLQRCIRGWYHRRRFLKMRAAAIVIQKNYRAHFYKRRYQRMKNGKNFLSKVHSYLKIIEPIQGLLYLDGRNSQKSLHQDQADF